VIDEKPRDERRAGHPHVAENPVDSERHTRVLTPLHDKREADWVVDCREEANGEEANSNLEWCFRERGEN